MVAGREISLTFREGRQRSGMNGMPSGFLGTSLARML